MDCRYGHNNLLVIVNYLDIRRTGRICGPFKANPPTVIDANAVLTLAVSLQCLQTVAGQRGQVAQGNRGIQLVQLKKGGALNSGESLDALTGGELSSSLVPIADDHESVWNVFMRYVKRNETEDPHSLP